MNKPLITLLIGFTPQEADVLSLTKLPTDDTLRFSPALPIDRWQDRITKVIISSNRSDYDKLVTEYFLTMRYVHALVIFKVSPDGKTISDRVDFQAIRMGLFKFDEEIFHSIVGRRGTSPSMWIANRENAQ